MSVTWQILLGDVRQTLASLPDASVQCCVTSPPYWGLRDYGTAAWDGGDPACAHRVPATGSTQNKGNNNREGTPFVGDCGICGARRVDSQLGLEPTPDAYVANLVQVFRDVRRVLRDDGVLWLNLGDSYAHSLRQSGAEHAGAKQNTNEGAIRAGFKPLPQGLKEKDLVGAPWRVAFALQADGWYLRSDIIWSKPNPMPESVTDRPTKAHEYLFLLTKAPRYYYDATAIAEAQHGEPHAPGNTARGNWREVRGASVGKGMSGHLEQPDRVWASSGTRNKRSVWHIATQPYPEAHFATFPEALIEPCILAGTSEKGQCPACGAPWARVVEQGEPDLAHQRACGGDASGEYHGTARKAFDGTRAQNASEVKARILAGMRKTSTVDWQPSCACDAGDPVPQTVLDPFCGSGTTGAVAIRHQRSFIGCELNPAYLELARRRIGDVAPLLAREVA